MWPFSRKKDVELTVEELYAKLVKPITTLGNYPLSETVEIRDMDIPREELLLMYNHIKRIDFDGNMVDFLCWVSTQVVAKNMKGAPGPRATISEIFSNSMALNPYVTTNALRLFIRNPNYLLDALEIKDLSTRRKTAVKLYEQWYILFFCDNLLDEISSM